MSIDTSINVLSSQICIEQNQEGQHVGSRVRVYNSSPRMLTVQIRGQMTLKHGRESDRYMIAGAALLVEEAEVLAAAILDAVKSAK
jgi:hypothetical protein